MAWDVDRLVALSKGFPRIHVPLSSIRELDELFWFSIEDAPTCRAVIGHARLIDAADLSFPIILSSDGRVMDGMHRVGKAALLGRSSIEAVQFTHDPEPDYVGVHPDDLPYDEAPEDAMSVERFYDELAPFYHLIFPDWEASIRRQAEALDQVIRERWGDGRLSILDVACGIGTQALGLAALGHRVTASDISAGAVERARREAAARGLAVRFSVADMRQAAAHHREPFDLVIACDNSLPHLLTDEDLLAAFGQLLACTRPEGGCLISVRDYDREERSAVQVRPYAIREEGGTRYLVWQVWEFHGSVYDLAMYFVEDRGETDCTIRVMRSRYYAVGIAKLMELMRQAGFAQVERLDGCFYQPILVGRRPTEPAAAADRG